VNLMVGCRMQQACERLDEQAVEVGRNHEDGPRTRLAARAEAPREGSGSGSSGRDVDGEADLLHDPKEGARWGHRAER
jgi:hypothetical protein